MNQAASVKEVREKLNFSVLISWTRFLVTLYATLQRTLHCDAFFQVLYSFSKYEALNGQIGQTHGSENCKSLNTRARKLTMMTIWNLK
jgi:hypothetical protein